MEERLEWEKLFRYFPPSPDPATDSQNALLRRFRFNYDFERILIDFQRFMGASLLVHVISTYEHNLLQICREHESIVGLDLESFRGRDRGPKRLLKYALTVAKVEIDLHKIQYVECGILFRNCIAHAGGLLGESRDEKQLRKVFAEKLYWPLERREELPNPELNDEPRIVDGVLGDELFVPAYYAYWLCDKAKEILISLCPDS